MSDERLVREFGDASAPLRRAAEEEVVICSPKGVGPCPPIRRIIIELEDLPSRPEPVDPVNDIPADQLANSGQSNDDWAV